MSHQKKSTKYKKDVSIYKKKKTLNFIEGLNKTFYGIKKITQNNSLNRTKFEWKRKKYLQKAINDNYVSSHGIYLDKFQKNKGFIKVEICNLNLIRIFCFTCFLVNTWSIKK